MRPLIIIFLVSFYGNAFGQADSTKHPRIYPVIYFSPETSLGLGVTTFKLFHLGDESRTSNYSLTGVYTLKNQVLIEGITTVFFDHEKWLVKGRVNLKHFPENFYGIGEKAKSDDKLRTTYSYYNIQSALYRKIFRGAFLGLQGTYNDYFNVSFNGNSPENLTGQNGSRNVGLGASFLYDTRDNVLNARRGLYTELSVLVFSNKLGTQYSYNAYVADFRKYYAINKKGVLAWQGLGLIKTGNVPFLQLSYLGGSDIMRGIYSGRYRDKVLLAIQIEYRRQLSEDWGAVAFAGLGNVTDHFKSFDIHNLKNSVGVGARYMLDKKDRMNLRFDAGIGDGHLNFYVSLAEAF
jgi:hypothetical protein